MTHLPRYFVIKAKMQQIRFVVYSSFTENNARFPRYRESRYVVAELLIVALFSGSGRLEAVSCLCPVLHRCHHELLSPHYCLLFDHFPSLRSHSLFITVDILFQSPVDLSGGVVQAARP